MRTFLRGKITLLFMTFGLLLAIPAVALADDIRDGLDTAASETQTITAGDSTSTGFTNQYWIVANGAGTSPAGCDVLAENDSVTATFQVNTPAGVTASVSSLTFDECRAGSDLNSQTVKFTSNTPGNYTIPALTKTSGTGTYTTNNSDFTLVVNDNCPDGDTSGNLQDGKCVSNSDPTVKTDAGNVSGNEGSALANNGAFADADGNGTLTITKKSGLGTVTDHGDGTWSWSYTPADNSSGTVEVKASDGQGGTDAVDSFTWTANNVAPTATFEYPSAAVNEGSSFDLKLTNPTDPAGTNDTLSYAFDCGGGSFVADSDGVASCSTTDDGTRNVRGKIMDEDGGSTVYPLSGTATVTIDNVRPSVTGLTNQNATEGTSKSFSLGSFTDPGDDGAWTATVDWGDGSSESLGSFNSPGSLGSKSHTYADEGTGSYTVTVTVTEAGSNAPSGSNTFTATVTNALPVVNTPTITDPNGGVSCLGGNAVDLSATFSDAGSLDNHSATIDWGDGSTPDTVNTATSPVTGQHTYTGFGPYTITVTVTDNDGGSGNNTASQSFHYNIGTKLLSPVNDTTIAGSTPSLFKVGSTIPLKVNITDCNGVGVAGLSPTIKMIKTSSSTPLAGDDEGISTQPNDSNFVMRGDGSGQYIYNLASKSLPDSSATYKAQITVNGYTVTTLNYFGLKAK